MATPLHIYTSTQYCVTGEPVTFSLYEQIGNNIRPAPGGEYEINFNDPPGSTNIPITSHTFQYVFEEPHTFANIELYNTSNELISSFNFLRVDSSKIETSLDVARPNPSQEFTIPYTDISIPVNEWAIANTINLVVDQMYDNFSYLINSMTTFKSSPTRWAGWSVFVPSNEHLICSEIPTAPFEAIKRDDIKVYGVFTFDGSNYLLPLYRIEDNDYIPGTSLIYITSALPTNFDTSTFNVSGAYCSNVDNEGIQLLSGENVFSLPTQILSSAPFNHTLVDYHLLNITTGEEVDIENSDPLYFSISTCSGPRVIKTFKPENTIIPTRSTYTPTALKWSLKSTNEHGDPSNMFNWQPLLPDPVHTKNHIHSISLSNNGYLWTSRGSYIESIDTRTGMNEVSFSSQSIDLGGIVGRVKTINTNSDNTKTFTLDNLSHKIRVYEKNPQTNRYFISTEWGKLDGASVVDGMFRPNDLFVYKDDIVFLCDTGNRCVKRYKSVGTWEYTYLDILPADRTDTSVNTTIDNGGIITACLDINTDLHVVTKDKIIKFSYNGDKIKETEFKFKSRPVKCVPNIDSGLIYICCEDVVYKFDTNHNITGSFFRPEDFQNKVGKLTGIATTDNGDLLITDGNVILKYLDLPILLKMRSSTMDSIFWTREDIYIDKDEFVTDWVYNGTIRRLAENLEILFRSLENKLLPTGPDSFEQVQFSESDGVLLNNLPFSLTDICGPGFNEIVTPEVLNKSIHMIYANIEYLFLTATKEYYINEDWFTILPPTLPTCCWSWGTRTDQFCCTPWSQLYEKSTWAHATSPDNLVVLNKGWFEIPAEVAININRINSNFTASFWLSAGETPSDPINIIGIEDPSHGFAFSISGNDLVVRLKDTSYTFNDAIIPAKSDLTLYTFTKSDTAGRLYINGYIDETKENLPNFFSSTLIEEDDNTLPSYNFIFGDKGPNDYTIIISNVWLFDIDATEEEVQSLYLRDKFYQLSWRLRQNSVGHWYCSSKYIWVDNVNYNYAVNTDGGENTRVILYSSKCCTEEEQNE